MLLRLSVNAGSEQPNLSWVVGLCSALVLAANLLVAPEATAQEAVQAPSETVRQVRQALDRLPYYGVFDFLAFGVKDRVVTLQGFVQRAALKKEAEVMVRKATGLEIANQIEVLPVGSIDEGLRWEAYLRLYSDDFATRYVSGGSVTTRYETLDMLRFPGMEPYGNYPVHIIVKNRKLLLVGVVDSAFDKQALILRARSVPHTLGLEDGVLIRGKGTR